MLFCAIMLTVKTVLYASLVSFETDLCLTQMNARIKLTETEAGVGFCLIERG